MRALLICALAFYQRWISPLFLPRCRFLPTCSGYAMDALRSFSLFKALYLIARRLLKCHPFVRSKGWKLDELRKDSANGRTQ